MFRLNDTAGERHEIGNSISANQLVYASMHKYIKENDKAENKVIKLFQLKCKRCFLFYYIILLLFQFFNSFFYFTYFILPTLYLN